MKRRLRSIRSPGTAGTCVLVLVLASLAVATAPLPTTGCPSALVSLTRPAAKLPADEPPQLSPGVVAADAKAVADARTRLDAHSKAVEAARKSATAAETLGRSAAAAQAEADRREFTDDYSFEVDASKSRVEVAEQMLESAEEELESSLQMQKEARSDAYSDPAIYDDMGASSRNRVAKAKDELAKARAELSEAEGKKSAASSERTSREKRAASLTAQADAAARKALGLVEDATSRETALQSALDAAKRTQAEHVTQHENDVAAWSHRHRVKTDEVRARNAVRATCSDAGQRTLLIAGGLLATAVLVLTASLVRRRGLGPVGSP